MSQLVTDRPRRLVFIDVVRAYAILMMLQGHFTDTLLADAYRDLDNGIYATWAFMRGMTAPIFFATTGLVFTFLLLKDGRSLAQNERVRKGIRRGFFLVGVGYLLKVNFFALAVGHISPWYFTIDVLHIIGIALISLIGVYALSQLSKLPFPLLLLASGLGVFVLNAALIGADWSAWPRLLAHYFTGEYGSVFTIIPWVGYTLIGGILGWLMHHRPQWAFGHGLPLVLLGGGYYLTTYSDLPLQALIAWTDLDIFRQILNNNYLLWRLGHVAYVFAIFMWVIPRLPVVPRLWSRIGNETLTIYGVHYVLLYGTWIGLGIGPLVGARSLDPVSCFIGALLFLTFFVVLIQHIDTVRATLATARHWVINAVALRWRWLRIGVWQYVAAERRRKRLLPRLVRQVVFS